MEKGSNHTIFGGDSMVAIPVEILISMCYFSSDLEEAKMDSGESLSHS